MMTSSPTNKRTKIRFGGPEDTSIRSAWKSTNRSFKPPSPAERKATLGMDTIEKARSDAELVASLDAGSSHEFSTNRNAVWGGSNSHHNPTSTNTKKKAPSLPMPSALKQRSQTVPILKGWRGTDENKKHVSNNNCPMMPGARSAWKNTETSTSVRSMMGPVPAQRQNTLEEADLKDVCASVANSFYTTLNKDSSLRDVSHRSFRGSSTRSRDTSLSEASAKDRSNGGDPRW